tara:strand:- start:1454 stop:1735 length:282 start_codon:yes stop_codon:yes gene_type:complete
MLLGDIGLTRYNGVQTPITYQEISAFCTMAKITMTRPTLALVRELSETYVNGLFKYKDKNATSPYYSTNKTIEEKRAEVANKFKTLAASRGKK